MDQASNADGGIAAIEARLAGADRRSLGPTLDELARLAAADPAALRVLLGAVVEHNLAEVSIRKVFFDEALVDDAIQETVLAVAGGIAGFRSESTFLTWLDRVAVNVALQMKRRGRRLSEPVSNELPEWNRWVRRVSSVVADEVIVARALADLSPEHREVIQLREMTGLSYDQIADRLGIAVGTVRSRLNRARAELADHLVAAQQGRA